MTTFLKKKIRSIILINLLLLSIIGYFLFMHGNGNYTLFDNSETNYSCVAREVINTGDYLTMHYNGNNWYVHPPLYFWLSSTLCRTFGWTEYNLRFWEGIFGILGILFTYLIAKRFFSNQISIYSAVILGTSFYYFIISRLAVFDTLLNTFILASIYFFFLAYEFPQKKGKYFFFFAITTALAVMSKGPIGLVHPGMVIIPFLLIKKNLNFLWDRRVWLNFLFFLAMVAPWYSHQLLTNGKEFFDIALKDYTWFRFFGVVESQPGPWYYYFPVLLTFFPWIFFIPAAIKNSTEKHLIVSSKKTQDFIFFSWLFIIITFIFFSFAGTKLPNYIFAMFPFLSILISWSFFQTKNRILIKYCAITLLVVSAYLVYLSVTFKLPYPYQNEGMLLFLFFFIPSIGSALLMITLLIDKPKTGLNIMLLTILIFTFFLSHYFFPKLEKYKESKGLYEAIINKENSEKEFDLVFYRWYSPYVEFYLNKHAIYLHSPEEWETLLTNQDKPIFLIINNYDLKNSEQLFNSGKLLKNNFTKNVFKF